MSTTPTCPRCNSTNVEAHMTPYLPKGEADTYAPVREYGFYCKNCKLSEVCANNDDGYRAFCERWKDVDPTYTVARWIEDGERLRREEEADKRAWMWPDEYPPGDICAPTDRQTRRDRLEEARAYDDWTISVARERGLTLPPYRFGYPVGDAYTGAVIATPDPDEPRLEYSRWLRAFTNAAAQATASFIEWQVRFARALRQDPRADLRPEFPDGVFERRTVDELDSPRRMWWREPGPDCVLPGLPGGGDIGLGESVAILRRERLIDDAVLYRGFVEHVAVRASRFLEIADELYSLAPIRHLTITYCKGPDHRDDGLFRSLLDSPHLDRILSLRLGVRAFGADNEFTELNRFDDDDIARLAASKHLRRLAYLDLSDHRGLTVKAFEALAATPELPMLSFVRHDIYHYGFAGEFSFGNMGKQTRALLHRPLERYRGAIEARFGRREWLHPIDNYGTEDPDVEAVVEHPAAVNRHSP